MKVGRMTMGLFAASTLLLAGCAGDSVDVTNSAGEPVTQSSEAQAMGGGAAVQGEAPACPAEFAATEDDGLLCLGPGPRIDVLELAGVTVVPVWASWCAPCRTELPVLEELHRSGTRVVGIAAADNSNAAAALTQDLGLTFPSLQDPDSTTRASLGWSALPVTFVLRDGEIIGRISGQVTNVDELRQAVESSR